jgi:CHASE2 domain-containing sensor protein
VLWPVVSALLVSYGAIDGNEASLWGGLVTAVLGPVIAAINAKNLSGFRTAFYAVLAAGQAIVVGYGIATDEQIGVWLPLVSAIVGLSTGGVAAANTKTTE